VDQQTDISAIRARLASPGFASSVLSGHASSAASGHATFESAVGSLRFGVLHEWFGFSEAQSRKHWTPPLSVLVGLAQSAMCNPALSFRVAWIGRRCWPSPLFLPRALLALSVFLDPPDHASRLWCIDVASRCTHPTIVIADGSGVTLANTRRLQLASASGESVCMLARPPWEEHALSAATTRWSVARQATLARRPRWAVTLLRNKDCPVVIEDRPCIVVEFDHASGLIRIPSALGDSAIRTQAEAS
jgi:hypothetical protein